MIFLIKSFRNLKKAKVTSVKKLSTFDVISNEVVVFSENAMNSILDKK
jgi:ribosomal protein L4